MTLAKCISVQLASSRELTQIGNVFSPQSVMISEFICRIALELYFDILLIFHNGKFSLKRSLAKKGEKYIKDQGKQVVNPTQTAKCLIQENNVLIAVVFGREVQSGKMSELRLWCLVLHLFSGHSPYYQGWLLLHFPNGEGRRVKLINYIKLII